MFWNQIIAILFVNTIKVYNFMYNFNFIQLISIDNNEYSVGQNIIFIRKFPDSKWPTFAVRSWFQEGANFDSKDYLRLSKEKFILSIKTFDLFIFNISIILDYQIIHNLCGQLQNL